MILVSPHTCCKYLLNYVVATNVLQDGALSEIHFISTFDTDLPLIMSEGWGESAARNLQADRLKEECRNEDVGGVQGVRSQSDGQIKFYINFCQGSLLFSTIFQQQVSLLERVTLQ